MSTQRSDFYQKKVDSISSFDYTLPYKEIDMRLHPHLYRIGRGEQGVLMVEPYKSEILPSWRFRTPAIAKKSASVIYGLFLDYLADGDFIGADMARKFLQMGFTRSRRYANHASGKKYKQNPQHSSSHEEFEKKKSEQLKQEADALVNEKAQSAKIFYDYYAKAKDHPEYLEQKKNFKAGILPDFYARYAAHENRGHG